MTAEWYPTAPVILTDDLWAQYAPPCQSSGTVAQRRAAYLAAEQAMVRYLGTPLVPTLVTGTFLWPVRHAPSLALPHNRVSAIHTVVAMLAEAEGAGQWTLTQDDATYLLRDATYGVIDLGYLETCLRRCGCPPLRPYQVYIEYTAGLPTGVAAADTSLHMALAMAASLSLADMVDPSALEGGAGDPGVQSFSQEGYSETRVPLVRTAFGTSARANRIVNLVRHLRLFRPLRM